MPRIAWPSTTTIDPTLASTICLIASNTVAFGSIVSTWLLFVARMSATSPMAVSSSMGGRSTHTSRVEGLPVGGF